MLPVRVVRYWPWASEIYRLLDTCSHTSECSADVTGDQVAPSCSPPTRPNPIGYIFLVMRLRTWRARQHDAWPYTRTDQKTLDVPAATCVHQFQNETLRMLDSHPDPTNQPSVHRAMFSDSFFKSFTLSLVSVVTLAFLKKTKSTCLYNKHSCTEITSACAACLFLSTALFLLCSTDLWLQYMYVHVSLD